MIEDEFGCGLPALPPAPCVGFWSQYARSPHNYNFALRLDGYLDKRALEKCLEILPTRHRMLARYFSRVDGETIATEGDTSPLPLTRIDMRDLPLRKREEELTYCWEKETTHPIEPSNAPLARTSLYALGQWHHLLLFVIHPSVAYEAAIEALIEDFCRLYTALIRDTALPESLSVPEPVIPLSPWQGPVTPAPMGQVPLDLPAHDSAPTSTHVVGASLTIDTSRRLMQLSERMGVPRQRLFLATLVGTISRYCGRAHFRLGFHGLLGTSDATTPMHLTTRIIDSDINHQPTFREYVHELHANIVTGRAFVPQEDSSLGLVFAFRKASKVHRVPQLDIVRESRNILPAALVLTVLSDGEQVHLQFSYDPKRYRRATVERLSCHLLTMLHAAVTFPDQPVHQLPMLTREERSLLRNWQQRTKTEEGPLLLHDVMTQLAGRHPERLALSDASSHWRFGQIERRANQLARYLRHQGLRVGQPVALVMRPTAHLVLATLAIFKAGAVVLPISPDSSSRRTSRLLGRASVRFVMGGNQPTAAFEASGIMRVDVPTVVKTLDRFSPKPLDLSILPCDPALLRYPVMGTHLLTEHETLLDLIGRQRLLTGAGGEHIVYMTHLESDTWLCDLFAIWKNGGTVLLADNHAPQPIGPSQSSTRLAG